jgi:hypothetical protein
MVARKSKGLRCTLKIVDGPGENEVSIFVQRRFTTPESVDASMRSPSNRMALYLCASAQTPILSNPPRVAAIWHVYIGPDGKVWQRRRQKERH